MSRRSSPAQRKHQAKFKAAAKRCKGTGRGFNACIRREMKK